jgi:hypothetical protein
MYTFSLSLSLSLSVSLSHTHIHKHTNTHTHAHTRTHAHTHTYTHTYTHTHTQVMAHMQGLEYAAMPAPGSEFLEPSARDRYTSPGKGSKDAAKAAVHLHNPHDPHNPYAGVNLSHIMGKPSPSASKALSVKGPAGKAKCKPPRASSLSSAAAKSRASSSTATAREHSTTTTISANPALGNNEFAALGAAKGSRGTRCVCVCVWCVCVRTKLRNTKRPFFLQKSYL